MRQVMNRIKAMLARSIIHLVNDEAGRQFAQVTVLAGEVKDDVERYQLFGITSVPPAGTSGIVAFLGGDRSKPVIIADNNSALRKKGLNSGESALYDAFEQFVYLKNDGSIEINTNGELLIKSATKTRIEGNLEVTGQIIDLCDTNGMTMSGMREVYNTHTHNENDEHANSPTDEPNQPMEGGA